MAIIRHSESLEVNCWLGRTMDCLHLTPTSEKFNYRKCKQYIYQKMYLYNSSLYILCWWWPLLPQDPFHKSESLVGQINLEPTIFNTYSCTVLDVFETLNSITQNVVAQRKRSILKCTRLTCDVHNKKPCWLARGESTKNRWTHTLKICISFKGWPAISPYIYLNTHT